MTLRDLLFWMYAVSACGGALAVVCSQNVARMVFGLIVSLGSVAGLFMLLGADFIGLTQLLVYVGGTLVLLIFGIMLTATGPLQVLKARPAEILTAAVVGLGLFGILLHTAGTVPWRSKAPGAIAQVRRSAPATAEQGSVRGNKPVTKAAAENKVATAEESTTGPSPQASNSPEQTGTSGPIALALVGLRTETNAAGKPRAGYLLPFELLSVHLLVVLIGAAYLARARRHEGELLSGVEVDVGTAGSATLLAEQTAAANPAALGLLSGPVGITDSGTGLTPSHDAANEQPTEESHGGR